MMKVVTGVVGNDIHVVANRLIDISLQARGFEEGCIINRDKILEDFKAMERASSELFQCI